MNIKHTLAIRFTVFVAVLLTAFSVIIYQNYSHYRKTDYYERLLDRTNVFAKMCFDIGDYDSIASMLANDVNLRPLSNYRLAVLDMDKLLISNSPNMFKGFHQSALDKLKSKGKVEFFNGDTAYLAYLYKHENKTYTVASSSIDWVGKTKITFLKKLILISLLIGILFTAITSWFFAGLSLKPIKKVIDDVGQITANNLHKRLIVAQANDEIASLNTTFNLMLDRLETSFVMQKNFVSNASHEFRTPITAMKAQIEVMLFQERSKEEYISTLKSLEEDIDNFIELVTSLSELAKADILAQTNKYENVPLIEIVAESRAELLRSKPLYTINLQIENLPENESENYILGNSALLKSAIKNLLENACKFSPEQKCEVSVVFVEGSVLVTITDEGIGIAEDELPYIFEPFFRSNDTRGIAGHGIGLSLVKKIIELHRGDIKVESNTSKGTKMIVVLPNALLV